MGSHRQPRPATADRRHRLRRALAAAAAVVALTSCGVRLETPPPEVPVADATEQARQEAALAASELHAMAVSARDAMGGGADGRPVLDSLIAVETATTAHHQALGGVWEPWPGAGPEATAYPGPDGSPTTPGPQDGAATPEAVLDLLEESAADAHAGAVTHPGELGQLLASVAISRNYLAADLADVLSVPAQTLPAQALAPPDPGSVDPDTSRALDAARYAFEVVAARSSGGQRAAAAERAEQLGEVAGAVAPEEDQRDVAYDVSGGDRTTTPERTLAAAAELDVVRAHVALLAADDGDRDALLAAATYAAGQARSWDAALPALPGLA